MAALLSNRPALWKPNVMICCRSWTGCCGSWRELARTNIATSLLAQIEALRSRWIAAVEPLSAKEQWKLAAVYAGMYGGVRRKPWEQLVEADKLVLRESAKCHEDMLKYGPVLPENLSLEEEEQVADETLQHLELGGKRNALVLWKHQTWRAFIAGARINDNGRPRLAAHFDALRKQARLKILRREIGGRWDRQVALLGAPSSSQMGEAVENTLIQFCDLIQDRLAWHENVWKPLQEELRCLGFLWDKFIAAQPVSAGAFGELARIERAVVIGLAPILFSRLNKLKSARVTDELSSLRPHLELAARTFRRPHLTAQLAHSVGRRDASGYAEAYWRLAEVRSLRPQFELRRSLLSQLVTAAPAWAAAIRNREGVHSAGQVPGDLMEAWTWRQLNDELVRRAAGFLESFQRQSQKLRPESRRRTVDLNA